MKNITSIIIILITIISCKAQVENSNLDKTDFNEIEKLTKNKNYQEALNSLKNYPEDHIETKYFSAFCHFKLKDLKLAENLFEQVYKIKPSHRYTCLFYSQSKIGQIDLDGPRTEMDLTKMQNAVEILSKGIELTSTIIPNDILARYYATRGQLLQLLDEFESALSDLNKAIELDPQGDYYTRRAMTYYLMNKSDLACADFQKGKELGETYNEEEIKKYALNSCLAPTLQSRFATTVI
jgi:tetratricopeptide (TPR) repeat protein